MKKRFKIDDLKNRYNVKEDFSYFLFHRLCAMPPVFSYEKHANVLLDAAQIRFWSLRIRNEAPSVMARGKFSSMPEPSMA
jgi:hypothetical protein